MEKLALKENSTIHDSMKTQHNRQPEKNNFITCLRYNAKPYQLKTLAFIS